MVCLMTLLFINPCTRFTCSVVTFGRLHHTNNYDVIKMLFVFLFS